MICSKPDAVKLRGLWSASSPYQMAGQINSPYRQADEESGGLGYETREKHHQKIPPAHSPYE